MKILQVNKFFYMKGGSEAYLFSIIEGLKGKGVRVAEFAMEDPKNHPSDWSKYFVSAIDYETNSFLEKIRFATKIIYSWEARKNIGRLLDEYKPDIVHLHIFQHQLSPSILPEIKKRNIPIIYTAHDLKSICPNYKMYCHGQLCEKCKGHKYYNCLINKCVKNSYLKSIVNVFEMYFHLWRGYYDLIDLIITPSAFYRNKLVEFGFPKEKVVYLPNFVVENQYSPSYIFQDYFIYFGRLSEEKGIFTLVEAMRHVQKSKCIIIGTGPCQKKIEILVKHMGLTNIELVGFKAGPELKKLIQNCMFSVIPSEWYENCSISLLESFAYGKGVIGSNIGGITEQITNDEDGLIFKAGDPEDLADKINSLIKTPNRIQVMGKNARTKIEKVYSRKLHVDKILHLYNQLIVNNMQL